MFKNFRKHNFSSALSRHTWVLETSIKADLWPNLPSILRSSSVLLPIIIQKITEDKWTINGKMTEDERRMAERIRHKPRTKSGRQYQP